MKSPNIAAKNVFTVFLLMNGAVNAEHRALLRRAPDNWPIKTGYVAFGDSFGAGMGTGTTSSDACRVGSNNFGDLLYKWTNNDRVDFQRKVCSGDTTVGLNRQIDEWKNPRKADIATVSIGGNDLGFSNMVYYCILTFNHFLFPWTLRKECKDAKDKARRLMEDRGDGGLRSKLKKAYKKILDKSGRDDFHLYVTSYIGFFNHDDPDCDKTTFDYWWAGYNPSWDPRIVYLTRPVRKELNGLVGQLNDVIRGAIDDANNEHRSNQVHFVDVGSKWANHRWCEAGNFHEPDPGRKDTWFFLSGWPDVEIEGASIQAGINEEQNEIKALVNAGKVELPDHKTCGSMLGSDPDPWANWLCNMAKDVAKYPNGETAKRLKMANEEIAKKDFKGQHIPSYTPTRQIKTFHPRSPGMVAYRDKIIETIHDVQINTKSSGTCKLAITQIWTCEAADKNLYARVQLTGSDGKVFYTTQQSAHTPGLSINNSNPLKIKQSNMRYELKIIGEHKNDYIQFYHGKTAWTSGTSSGEARCKLKGKDWDKKGPGACPTAAFEDVNIKIDRGKGAHLQDVTRVAGLYRKYGIRFKLNTVVNKYNFDEDMDEHNTALNPLGWKMFQVLIIEEENDSKSTLRDAGRFAISEEQFQQFCKAHKNHKCLIPESNTVMKSSYLLMAEYMLFLNKGVGDPSPSILDVGVMEALRQVYWDTENFHQRCGIYDWSTKAAGCSTKDPKLDFS
ncbi:hypothetical protein LOZ65_001983 [Ophidiomyces ophidiicola]|nr:hypothetical protein LOZ65_001983 [Ophidiomyces ophidiicola]